jgi:CheY-like chemotaxis protein
VQFPPPGNVRCGGTRSLPNQQRVLVADRDEIVAALVSHILHRQGYSVDIALAADEAASRLAATQYAALLVDSKLAPDLAEFSPSRTIILSDPGAPDPPAFATIRKPIEFALLVETVAACLKDAS